jgi:hypothetical protein
MPESPEAEILKALRLAGWLATQEEQNGGAPAWVANLRHILDALDAAICGIKGEAKFDGGNKVPARGTSAKFLGAVRNLSLGFLHNAVSPAYSKHRKPETFRKEFLPCLEGAEWERIRGNCFSVAYLLQSGTLVYPALRACDIFELAERLKAKLPHDFFDRVALPGVRAQEILLAAGVPAKPARYMNVGAAEKKVSRVKIAKRKR